MSSRKVRGEDPPLLYVFRSRELSLSSSSHISVCSFKMILALRTPNRRITKNLGFKAIHLDRSDRSSFFRFSVLRLVISLEPLSVPGWYEETGNGIDSSAPGLGGPKLFKAGHLSGFCGLDLNNSVDTIG